MAQLTESQVAVVQGVINLMAGNYEKPLDATVIDRLAPLHAALGFSGEIPFREALRDAPFSALLTGLVTTNS
jgi:hypothetical protein